MATLLDIARAAGVSKMTVSNALRGKSNVSEATRARIIQTAQRLNYQTNLAARALSSGRNGILEFIIQDLDSPFYSKLAKEVSRAADANGMQTLIRQSLYSAESEKSALSSTNTLFCDGLILATPQLSGTEARTLAQSRPLILIDDCSPDPQLATVNTPNYEGAYQAIAHLLSVGVRRPLLLGGTFIDDIDAVAADSASVNACNNSSRNTYDDAGDGAYTEDRAGTDASADASTQARSGSKSGLRPLRTVCELRVAGAAQALRDAGLELEASQCLPIDWTYEQTRKAIRDMAEHSSDGTFPFDGIFGMSDVAALGAIRGLEDAGLRVPDDVKVIGFDGVTYGDIATPSLSTIDIDMTAMANMIVSRLMEQLNRTDTADYGADYGSAPRGGAHSGDGGNIGGTVGVGGSGNNGVHGGNVRNNVHGGSVRNNAVSTTRATADRTDSVPTVDVAPFTLRTRESTLGRAARIH